MSERKTKDSVQCNLVVSLTKSDFYALSVFCDFELTDDIWKSVIAKKRQDMPIEKLGAEKSDVKMFKLALAAKILENNELIKQKHG